MRTTQATAEPATEPTTAWRVFVYVMSAAIAACGGGFEVARLDERPVAQTGAARIAATQVQLSDDLAESGVDHESEIVTELSITNEGTAPFALEPSALSLRLVLDPQAPGQTRALSPTWAGEGRFSDQSGDGGYHRQFNAVTVPPGATRQAWVVFRAHAFPQSEVPHRVSLLIRETPTSHTELTLADPARGASRWHVSPVSSAWTLGVQSNALFGSGFRGTGMALAVSRVATLGRFTWDVGLLSRLLHQAEGKLDAPTSAFSGPSINAHVGLPLLSWGGDKHLRRLSVFGGAEIGLLIAVVRGTQAAQRPPTYELFAGELGLELGFGAIQRAPTPFPLSSSGPTLPRLVARIGYTHWRIGDIGTNGTTTGFRLAW